MRGLKGLSKLVVVAMTAATLMLVAALGVSAASGSFGAAKVLTSVAGLHSNSASNHNNGEDKCKGDDDHDNATHEHKHHISDDNGGHSCGGDYVQQLTRVEGGRVTAALTRWILRSAVFLLPLALLADIV